MHHTILSVIFVIIILENKGDVNMNNFFNDDVRRSLERMSNIHNDYVASVLQTYNSLTPPSILLSLQSLNNELTKSLIQHQNILDDTNRTHFLNNQLSGLRNAATRNQITYLQNAVHAIQLNIPTIDLSGIQQLTETVSILSNNFQNYSILNAIDFPVDIENELNQAIDKTRSLDLPTENENVEYELTNDKSIDFITKLTLFLTVLSAILTAHSNYLQIDANKLQKEANQIEEEKVKVLESIDKNLEKINEYFFEVDEFQYEHFKLE